MCLFTQQPLAVITNASPALITPCQSRIAAVTRETPDVIDALSWSRTATIVGQTFVDICTKKNELGDICTSSAREKPKSKMIVFYRKTVLYTFCFLVMLTTVESS